MCCFFICAVVDLLFIYLVCTVLHRTLHSLYFSVFLPVFRFHYLFLLSRSLFWYFTDFYVVFICHRLLYNFIFIFFLYLSDMLPITLCFERCDVIKYLYRSSFCFFLDLVFQTSLFFYFFSFLFVINMNECRRERVFEKKQPMKTHWKSDSA